MWRLTIFMAFLVMSCVTGKQLPVNNPEDLIDVLEEYQEEEPENGLEVIGDTFGEDVIGAHDHGKEVLQKTKKWIEIGLPFPKDYVFKGVSGTSNTNIFVVGAGPIAYKYDGQKFLNLDPPSPPEILNAVFAVGIDDAWMVGMWGARLHYVGFWADLGCKTDKDCQVTDPCMKAVCKGGICSYEGDAKPGCCGFPSLNTGFDEGGLQDFEVKDLYEGQNNMGGIVWNVVSHTDALTGQPRYISPPNALYFGNPDKPCIFDPSKKCPDFDNGKTVGSTATSALITLPNGKSATLSFYVFIDTEYGMSFDILKVRVIRENGMIEDIWTKENVGGVTNKQFVLTKADITKYMGQKIRIQFLFDSGDSIANQMEGVYVDDVLVTTECGETPKPAETLPTIYDVSGTGGDNIFAVGGQGTVLKFDGKQWKQIGIKGPVSYKGICFNPETGLWVVGTKGKAVRNVKGTFVEVDTKTNEDLLACGNQGLAVGTKGTAIRLTENGIETIPSVTYSNLNAVYGLENGTVWAVGSAGTIIKYSEGKLTMLPMISEGKDLYGIFATSEKDIWVVGDGALVTNFNGLAWVTKNTGAGVPLYAIHGANKGDMLAVGMHGATLRYKDGQWEPLQSGTDSDLRGVIMVSSNEGYAVGTAGTIIKYDGSEKWQKMESPVNRNLWALTKDKDGKVWACGDGVVLRLEKDGWRTVMATIDTDLRAVYALDNNHVYIGGKGGNILMWDGFNIHSLKVDDIQLQNGGSQPFTSIIYGIWARNAQDIYAVSEAGQWLRYEDGVFKVYGSSEDVTLRGITGNKKGEVWMVGGVGTILHLGTQGLEREEVNTIATLYDVIAIGDDLVLAVGDTGTVLKRLSQ